jgi:chlorite dismutase
MSPRLFTFAAGASGAWRIVEMSAVVGKPLMQARRLEVSDAKRPSQLDDAQWTLHGVTSNDRYVTRAEKERLVAQQEGIGRPDSICAALIPIRKSDAWWRLTQDERRAIFEERSRHVQIGLQYLPAVARRLHHCRDLETDEPFDFLTWFEFAPGAAQQFDELVAALRATEEWKYVEREIDIRLIRDM